MPLLDCRSHRSDGCLAGCCAVANDDLQRLAVPGVQADKLDISLQGDVISVSGKSEWEVPEKAAAIWQGIQPREFRFAWRLPGEVEGSEVKAQLEQGILRLTLPKARAQRPRRITIETTGS